MICTVLVYVGPTTVEQIEQQIVLGLLHSNIIEWLFEEFVSLQRPRVLRCAPPQPWAEAGGWAVPAAISADPEPVAAHQQRGHPGTAAAALFMGR